MFKIARLTVLVASLMLTACNAASDAPQPPTTAADVGSTTSSTTIPSTTSSSSTTTIAPTTTTTTVPLGSGPIEDLDGQRRSGEFWYVGPGSYSISTLPQELELTLGEELSFVVLNESFIAFAEPGFLTFNKAPSVTLAELSGFADPTVNDQDMSAEPTSVPFGDDAAVTSYLEETEPFVLLSTGTDSYVGSDASWWEFTVDPASEGGGFRCAFSRSCYNVVVQPDHGYFVAAPGWVFRLWRMETGNGTLWAFMQTPEDQVSDGLDLASSVLSGLAQG